MILRHSLLFFAVCTAAFGDALVVPNAQTAAPGNNPINVNGGAVRFQEVIGGGQFNGEFAGPFTIVALRLRSGTGNGHLSVAPASLQLTLSTTQAYPNTNGSHTLPSITYAKNVGPDATVVYNGTFSGTSPGCLSPGPCAFDLVIPFSTPFTYDSSKGRLLIDLVAAAAAGTVGSLDGVAFPDSTSSTVAIVLGDPAQPSGSLNLAGFVFELDTGFSSITAVMPRSLTSAEGDSSSTTSGLFGSAAATIQFQITAAEVAAMGLNPGDQITGLRTRLNGGQTAAPTADITISNLDITLAQAALPIATMSTSFAANMVNPVLVSSGSYTIPANSMPGGSTPNSFGSLVAFSRAYTYTGGDLIVMYSKSTVSPTLTTDAANNYTGVGTAYRTLLAAGYQATAGNLGTGIAPLQFQLTPALGIKNSANYTTVNMAPNMIGFAQTANAVIAPTLVVAPDGPWPATLGNAHLDIEDSQGQSRPAPLYYVSPAAMTYLVPAGAAPGQGVAKLTTSAGATVSGTINIVTTSPGMYTMRATGSGVTAGIYIRVPASGAQSYGFLFDSNLNPLPLDLGPSGDQIFLSLYGTGFRGAGQPTATVGGVTVPIAGFAATGVYQGEDVINIGPLPRSLAGSGEVYVAILLMASPPTQ